MRKTLIYLLIFSTIVTIYGYGIFNALEYHPDLARDLYEILKITQGHQTLLGPKASFGGLYSGPYYYYFFVPVFLLSHHSIASIYLFNLLIFAFAIVYFFAHAWKRYPGWQAILATISLTLLPLSVLAARHPNNATTYLSLLIILLTSILFNTLSSPLILIILGFLFGTIINFHFTNLMLIPAILWLVISRLKIKQKIAYLLLGIGLTFAPLVLFELKHDFIILKNTFIFHSYVSWIANQNLPHALSGKQNIIANLFYISDQLTPYLAINPLVILAVLVIMLLINRHSDHPKINLTTAGALSLLITAVLIRFQFVPTYLYPAGFLLFFLAVNALLQSQYPLILLPLILLEIISFPAHLYQPAIRTSAPFEQAVKFVIDHRLVKQTDNFNLAQITNPPGIATLGYEYRYFFLKYGYQPNSEFQYANSNKLIVFSDRQDATPTEFPSWEIDQFGRPPLAAANQYQVGAISIYIAEKYTPSPI